MTGTASSEGPEPSAGVKTFKFRQSSLCSAGTARRCAARERGAKVEHAEQAHRRGRPRAGPARTRAPAWWRRAGLAPTAQQAPAASTGLRLRWTLQTGCRGSATLALRASRPPTPPAPARFAAPCSGGPSAQLSLLPRSGAGRRPVPHKAQAPARRKAYSWASPRALVPGAGAVKPASSAPLRQMAASLEGKRVQKLLAAIPQTQTKRYTARRGFQLRTHFRGRLLRRILRWLVCSDLLQRGLERRSRAQVT